MLVVATPDAATDSDVAAFGIIVLDQRAIGVGGASIPGPLADSGADWLWYSLVPLDAGGGTGSNAGSQTATRVVEIDSRAMRKMGTEEGLILVGEIDSGDFASVTVTGGLRALFGH